MKPFQQCVTLLHCPECQRAQLRLGHEQSWHVCRYILSIRLKQAGEAEEAAVLQWVEHAAPGAEVQQRSPGNLSFSIAQEVCLHLPALTQTLLRRIVLPHVSNLSPMHCQMLGSNILI